MYELGLGVGVSGLCLSRALSIALSRARSLVRARSLFLSLSTRPTYNSLTQVQSVAANLESSSDDDDWVVLESEEVAYVACI
jgi:hypothetical protein